MPYVASQRSQFVHGSNAPGSLFERGVMRLRHLEFTLAAGAFNFTSFATEARVVRLASFGHRRPHGPPGVDMKALPSLRCVVYAVVNLDTSEVQSEADQLQSVAQVLACIEHRSH